MTRILILSNHHNYTYNFRKEIIQALLDRQYSVYVVLPYGEKVELLKEMGCKYVEVSFTRHGISPLSELKLLFKYNKIIKEIQPDVVLSYTIKPNLYGGIVCRVLGIPQIANITGLGTAVENKGILQKITTIMYKVSFKKTSCIFFQNTENKKFFTDKGIAINKYRLIPGSGVNLSHFQVLEYPSEITIEFVFISRIMKEKGIDQYLEVAEYIRNKYPQTRFHVLGFCEERYEKKLKELQDKGIITYHGMQQDVRRVLAISHCIIHPSYYPEGMSNVLLESAACGRPIITTNRSGCREVVEHGVNGYVVEQKNKIDLIEKIEEFLSLTNEERKQMGVRGRKKVELEFDRDLVVKAYQQEIKKLLAL